MQRETGDSVREAVRRSRGKEGMGWRGDEALTRAAIEGRDAEKPGRDGFRHGRRDADEGENGPRERSQRC